MTDAELTVIFGHIDTLVPLHQGQHLLELGIIDSMGELKTNGVRLGCGHVVRSFTHEHIAQHTTPCLKKLSKFVFVTTSSNFHQF